MRLTNYIHNDFVIRKSINVAGHVPQQMQVSVGTSYAAVICIFSGKTILKFPTASNIYLGWWFVNDQASSSMRVCVQKKMITVFTKEIITRGGREG